MPISRQKFKTYMMPLAMLVGGVFFPYLEWLSFLTPYLIATMLFLSYSNVSMREIRITRLHICLLAIQIVGSVAVYYIINRFDPILAQGAFICIIAPTATSAVVITGMLDGNTNSLTSYSILCNMAVAIVAPVVFSFIDYRQEHISLIGSIFVIARQVLPLLLLPLIIVLLLEKLLPRVHKELKRAKGISFYLWVLALMIVTAKIVGFIYHQGTASFKTEILLFVIALVICGLQFFIGKRLGKRYGDTIAGGQGLGQKNTVLAIWMAQSYLNPLSSLAPGAYVLWQNIINSYQLWRKVNRDGKSKSTAAS